MHGNAYAKNTVDALLQSDRVTPATRAVLEKRVAIRERTANHFFSDDEYAILEAVCATLFPQEGEPKVPLPALFEQSLATGAGRGWRYDALPPMPITLRAGVKGIDEEAHTRYQKSFEESADEGKEEVLRSLQSGDGTAEIWKSINSRLFFEELLSQLTEAYYSHPFAKNKIGEIAFADAKGWPDIGLSSNNTLTPPTTAHDQP